MEDRTLETLLELDGERFVVDEHLGLWVKFEAKAVHRTQERPHGVRYSLSLHDRANRRLMGFDNAHAVEAKDAHLHDHWHRNQSDKGRPYAYENAGKLMQDFWKEVDQITKTLTSKK